jgi:hypothetical protein
MTESSSTDSMAFMASFMNSMALGFYCNSLFCFHFSFDKIIFRHDAVERFNEDFRYGRNPKIEMLWRLRVPGPWLKWPKVGLFELEQKTYVSQDVRHSEVPSAGWVARLFR